MCNCGPSQLRLPGRSLTNTKPKAAQRIGGTFGGATCLGAEQNEYFSEADLEFAPD